MVRSMRTKSELLFEKFCQIHKIQCRPIQPSGAEGRKAPDYTIVINRRKIVVEVKQLDPNLTESMKIGEFDRLGTVSIKSGLGQRVREKIKDTQGKFRIKAKNTEPSILVLYNNVKLYKHTEPNDILAGMFGQLVFQVVPGMPIGNMELGPNRTMTPTTNTSISAIGVLKEDSVGNPTLVVYHNPYAKVPLEPSRFAKYQIKQYSVKNPNDGFTLEEIAI
jgi:hypothetical protein